MLPSIIQSNSINNSSTNSIIQLFRNIRCNRNVGLLLIGFVLCNLILTSMIISTLDTEKHRDIDLINSKQRTGNTAINNNNNNNNNNLNQCNPSDSSVNKSEFDLLTSRLDSTLIQLETIKSSIITAATAAAAAAESQSITAIIPSKSIPWLIIAIPTVSRKSGADYLSASLLAIESQLTINPDSPYYNTVHIYIMNNNINPTEHKSFISLQQHYSIHPCQCFHFYNNTFELVDSTPELLDNGSPNIPGYRVRKQSRDIAALAYTALYQSKYYLFLEDDFELCPRTITIIEYIINKINKSIDRNWLSVRMSFGMNGFLVKNNQDLKHFTDYLVNKQRLRPPDHLLPEWAGGESSESAQYKGNRTHFAYRYNLMRHLGIISSLRESASHEYPPCYHELNNEVIFPIENYHQSECPNDDLYPCKIDNNKPINYLEYYSIPQKEIEEANLK